MAERFPAEVVQVLREAGWSEGRRTDEETAQAVDVICDVVGRYGARLESFDAAIEALTEFGGLYFIPEDPGDHFPRRPFALDPLQVAATAETLTDFGRVLDTRLFPLGMEGQHESVLAIDESGRVFALDHTGEWHLGDSVDAAVAALITGAQPARVNDNGDW